MGEKNYVCMWSFASFDPEIDRISRLKVFAHHVNAIGTDFPDNFFDE